MNRSQCIEAQSKTRVDRQPQTPARGRAQARGRRGHAALFSLCFLALLLFRAAVPAHAAVNTWTGSGPFATGLGNRVITALAVSADGRNVYSGTGSGTVFRYETATTLTVTADNKSRAYNAANPALTYTPSGFVNGDTASALSGSPALATTATAASAAGAYPITITAGTLAAANYTFSFVDGTLTVSAAGQTIAFNAIPAKTYGAADFDPGATAGSGMAVTYSSSNPAVAAIVSGKVHIVSAGTSTITAHQAGNAEWAAAGAPQTLTVNKATLTVTADNKSRAYNAANPALTYTPSGFVNGDTASALSGSPALATTATAASAAGAYPITITAGTLAAANYAFSFVNGTLTVSAAGQTIAFNAIPAKTYGAADFDPGATAGSGMAVTYTSFNPAVAVIVSGKVHVVGAGTAIITAHQAGNAGWAAASASQTLTVNKAPLTVTADNKSRAYNAANPALTYTPGGFVNGDSASALSGSPALATTATAASAAGAYPITITAGTLAAANYAFSFLNGTLTVYEYDPNTIGAIKGRVIYGGYQQGTLKVGVYSNADLASSHLVKEVNVPMARTAATRDSVIKRFTIADVQPGQYYLGAYIDANGNSRPDAEEANGRRTAPVNVVSGADSTGHVIALSDPLHPTGERDYPHSDPLHPTGEPLYYYQWKQSDPAWINIGPLFADADGDGYSNIQEYLNRKNGLDGFSPVTPDAPNGPGYGIAPTALYFPHVATSIPWQTEIAVINTGDQTVTGILRGLSDEGELVETKAVTLPARGRRQITVANAFTDHTNIGYITFDTDAYTVQGYTKLYREGVYRAAIPAVNNVNASDIPVPHIASNADWWTGVGLVNTTPETKELTITFNTGQRAPYVLNAYEHRAFDIASLFDNRPQPDIQSAVITNASGVIALELFGNRGGGDHLDGILLTDKTTSTLYYPHVAGGEWWTGIVAYNPSDSACTITVTPYSAQGAFLPLAAATLPLAGKGKYIGMVAQLGLPADTAWFKIDSTQPLSGFALFGTVDGNQLAAYAGGGGIGTKAGVYPKIEENGWTGIALVNTESGAATVDLTAYDDTGTAVATQVLTVGGLAKVVDLVENIFIGRDIRSATYIVYASDRNIVGFQLNGTSDGMMLDGLPGLAGAN